MIPVGGLFLSENVSVHDLPTGWRMDLLDNLAKRGSGHTPDKQYLEYWNGGIKWVSLADSGRLDQVYIYETDKEISELGIQNSSATKHPAGTVVLSRDAGVGKSAILASEMAVSQHFIAWVCGPSLDNHFLYYWLQYMKPEFERMAVGSTIKTIGLGYFRKLEVIYPPLAEQRKIAAILGTWDAAIATVEQLIAALQTRKQGLMQRLLTGAVRFPEFAGREWERQKFSEVFERVTRKNTSGNTNVLTASAQHGLVSQIEYFNRSVAGANLSNYYLLKKGEFAYNRSSSDGYPFGAIKQLEEYDAGILSTLYICFRMTEGAGDATFYKHYFESGGLNQGIYMIAQEGARNHGLLNVGLSDFFDLDIVAPSLEEQHRIAEVFELQEHLIDTAKRRHAAIVRQKHALMQQLLTGQVRVKVAGDNLGDNLQGSSELP